MSTTVRIDDHSKALLKELAAAQKKTQQEILAEAIDKAWRQQILDAGNAAYARLREDKEAWDDYQNEIKAWDCTLLDGLEGDEYPQT